MLNVKQLSIEEIQQKIENEIKNEDEKIVVSKIDDSMKKYSNKPIPIHEFMKYHDEKFINNIYRVTLQREPSKEEFWEKLNILRSGKISKIDILLELRFSIEGRSKNIRIREGRKRYMISRLLRTPIFGYLIRLFTPTKTIQRQNRIEANIYREINKLKSINYRNASDQKKDEGKIENKLLSIDYMWKQLTSTQHIIDELVSKAKERLPNKKFEQEDLQIISDEEQHRFDAFYVAFEDEFRGSRELIRERVSIYLPYLDALPFQKKVMKILDFGCGRGEWIELLSDNGYDVQGIDLNRVMVSLCQNRGLSVIAADAIDYLKDIDDESISIITGFHIIEHLPFEILMKFFEETFRVLQPGGIVIFETPNPKNLRVGSHTFYFDPTHINPIPPLTTAFLLQYVGFDKTEELYPFPQDKIETDNVYLNNFINNSLQISPDYAIIGYKR